VKKKNHRVAWDQTTETVHRSKDLTDMGNLVPSGRATSSAQDLLSQLRDAQASRGKLDSSEEIGGRADGPDAPAQKEPLTTNQTSSSSGGRRVDQNGSEDDGLPHLIFQESLGEGRFSRAARCQAQGRALLAKLYERRGGEDQIRLWQEAAHSLTNQNKAFSDGGAVNVLPFENWGAAGGAAVLVRQYVHSSLYERQSTRPFLGLKEKVWITFQLLSALRQSHSRGVVHGDIKSENVMVLSHDWVLLTDFAPFKPVFLPLDDTAPFNYFFSSNSKRDSCSVAPERFRSPTAINDISLLDSAPSEVSKVLSAMLDDKVPSQDAEHVLEKEAESMMDIGSEKEFQTKKEEGRKYTSYSFGSAKSLERLRPAMDIFSCGCVIAELFLDGEPCFSLAELLRYAQNEEFRQGYLDKKLAKIQFKPARDLVKHMLSANPSQRESADWYLRSFSGEGKIFPAFFESFLHPLMASMFQEDSNSPDRRLWRIVENYSSIIESVCRSRDQVGADYFSSRLLEWRLRTEMPESVRVERVALEDNSMAVSDQSNSRRRLREHKNLNEIRSQFESTMQKVDTLRKLRNLEGLSEFLPAARTMVSSRNDEGEHCADLRKRTDLAAKRDNFRPEIKDLDEAEDQQKDVSMEENDVVIIISFMCNSMRYARFPATKVVALRLLQRLGRFSNDETRLQRMVPFVVNGISDASSLVRCTALRVLTGLLFGIRKIPSSDRRLFPDYIYPALARMKVDMSLNVRLVLAECLPRLAEVSARFLEFGFLKEGLSQMKEDATKRNSPGSPHVKAFHAVTFDAKLVELRSILQDFVINMIEQPTVVRRTLLHDVTRLCLFFGREWTAGYVLPILITCLNERDDWQLRATFFEQIPGVCAQVGPLALKQYLLPCIIEALYDPNELVVAKTLTCLYSLARMDLLEANLVSEMTVKAVPLLYHPSHWIRRSLIQYFAAIIASERFSYVEIQLSFVIHLREHAMQNMLENLLLLGKAKDVEKCGRLLEEMLQTRLSRARFDLAVSQLSSDVKNHSVESWLMLSRKSGKKDGAPKEQQREEDEPLSLSDDEKKKFKHLEEYFKAGAESRRGHVVHDVGQSLQVSPDDYMKKLSADGDKGVVFSVLVPEQSSVTLALHGRYSDVLDQNSSAVLLHKRSAFRDVINQYGIISRSRRHGGQAISGVDALSGGEHRLLSRIRALEIPPLPPDMGSLKRLDGSRFMAPAQRASSKIRSMRESSVDAAATPNERTWRPRGILAVNLYGHEDAVNRIAVSQDGLYFATASDDGTVRLWISAGLDEGYGIRPRLTYSSQGGCIADLCVVQNTHSIASASSEGSVHVFRIEHALAATNNLKASQGRVTARAGAIDGSSTINASSSVLAQGDLERHNDATAGSATHSVPAVDNEDESRGQSGLLGGRPSSRSLSLGLSTVVEIDASNEGSVRAVAHFSAMSESMLVFATDAGTIHGWDLRKGIAAWKLRLGPQAGLITAIALPQEGDPVWLVVGTSRGILVLFDLRFSIILRAWLHPSKAKIRRLLISKATCSDPYVFVAGGSNEVALFNLDSGESVQCLRTVPTEISATEAKKETLLEPIDLRLLCPLSSSDWLKGPYVENDVWKELGKSELEASGTRSHNVRAILCPFDMFNSRGYPSHFPNSILTAGTDRRIRYWQAGDPSLCYSIFDQEFGMTAEHFWDSLEKTTLCREDISFKLDQQRASEGRGLPHASSNHRDAILDLAYIAPPTSSFGYLLSASRDGIVKAWI